MPRLGKSRGSLLGLSVASALGSFRNDGHSGESLGRHMMIIARLDASRPTGNVKEAKDMGFEHWVLSVQGSRRPRAERSERTRKEEGDRTKGPRSRAA
jgi:hypothetical protein